MLGLAKTRSLSETVSTHYRYLAWVYKKICDWIKTFQSFMNSEQLFHKRALDMKW